MDVRELFRSPRRGEITHRFAWKEERASFVDPVVTRDGFVAWTAADGSVQARSADGQRRWTAPGRHGSLAPAGDGSLCARTGEGKTRCLEPGDGAVRWEVALTGRPVPAGPETVAVVGEDGRLQGLDLKTGEPRWTADLRAPIDVGPATGPDGILYAWTRDGRMHALKDGATLDSWPAPKPAGLAPMQGRVAISRGDGCMEVREGARQVWESPPPAEPEYHYADARVAAGPDGHVYCATERGEAYSYHGETGGLRWLRKTGMENLLPPVPQATGEVLLAGSGGTPLTGALPTVRVLDGRSGLPVWSPDPKGTAMQAAAAGPEGTAVLRDLDGTLHVVQRGEDLPPESGPEAPAGDIREAQEWILVGGVSLPRKEASPALP